MKILHVIPTMDPQKGGMCQAVRTMSGGLFERGVLNDVVCLDQPDAAYLDTDKFRVHALGPGKGPWCYNTGLLPWLLQNMMHYDVVLVHGLWVYPGYAVRKAMNALRPHSAAQRLPKVFVMPHGMLDPYFQRAAGRRLKAVRNSIYWKLIEGKLINEVDGLLFTCEEEMRLAEVPFTPYSPRRRHVIGLGVEPPPPYSSSMKDAFLEKCPHLNGVPYILFLSRIHEKKGVDILIKAYASLAKNALAVAGETDNDAEPLLPLLVIAGPGLDTPYGREMQSMVAGYGEIADSIIFPGMLSGKAKWGAFYGCEAFVLPSHQENFGIAVVEALACGRPVLISNQVNIWREIHEAGGGKAAPDTIADTRKLLADWFSQPQEQKQAMNADARKSFVTHFSVAAATDHLLSAIKNN